MKPSETLDLLDNWYLGNEKPFTYKGHTLYWDEYLVIKKEDVNTYIVNTEGSSIRLEKTFTKEDMERMLYSDTLVPINDISLFYDYKYKKSDNCTCGSWILSNNEYLHLPWCKKYKKGY